MPIQLDAKLNAFRRSSKGFYITLEIGPDCDWTELASAPLGQAFGVAMVAYNTETGLASPGKEPQSLPGNTGQQRDEAGKSRKPWNAMSRANQAGILCADQRFQLWLSTRLRISEPIDCATALRNYLNVRSRSLLDEPEFNGPAMKFDSLVAAFRQETGQMAEQRS